MLENIMLKFYEKNNKMVSSWSPFFRVGRVLSVLHI